MRERHARKRLLTMAALAAVLIAAGATAVAYGLTGHDGSYSRPSGIPASIPDSQVNLMELSPVPVRPAPGFTLSDQDSQMLPLSAFRGKVVVLEFMDPHCTDICPIVSAEFTDAYRDLGRQASQVVFAAGNVNQYHHAVADVAAYSRAHQLTSIPSWHFFTGPVPRLRAVWNAYNIAVQAPGPDADIVHSSAVYFIDPGGPGAVPRLPAGRPHHVRGLLPARGPDRRLGTGHRAGRGTPRGLTSRAARQCSDMHRREPPLVTVRRYTGPVTATGHVIDILL